MSFRSSSYRSGEWQGYHVFLLMLLAFLLVASCVAVKSFGGLNIPYSEGSRSGTVTKISHKGMIWTTWEGELDLHRLTSTGGEHPTMTADLFYFSVSDDDVAKKVQEAEASGKRATLHYRQYLLRGWKYGGTSYDIVDVELSDQPVIPGGVVR